jgi:ATP-dependent DNA ligase
LVGGWRRTPAEKPPGGPGWLHEIKHDSYRLMARRDAAGVRLFTRNGHDWTGRFPLIREAIEALRTRSCRSTAKRLPSTRRAGPGSEHGTRA